MARKRLQLGQILKQWRLVDDKQISDALKVSEGTRKRIGEVLVQLGHVSENDVAKALASQFGLEFVDLDQPNVINKENLHLIPEDMIKRFLILPLGKEGNTIKVLAHDPMDINLIDDLQFRLGGKVELALSAKGKISEYIDTILSSTKASIDQLTQDLSVDASVDRGSSMDVTGEDGEELEELLEDQGPVVKLVQQIIAEAVTSRASDIHIEPFEDRVRLRYRIDGVCHERQKIPKSTQGSVIARLKIMAGVRVEEKRIPQDGRIKLKVAGDVFDFRFSSCPAYHGESIVMRILRPDAATLGLEKLGMADDTKATFNEIITRPNGIFLVTGPTGSGKTTTLYTALSLLNRPDMKIITAEDPIEYNFKGINQCQVNPEVGMTFPVILRAMLRQAPNVILVGEIRDLPVGEVAIQAALTGHLVFSTLHTNDAPSAMTRMIDMGLKPFLVASSVQAVLAQRLIRALCEECKEPDLNPSRKLLSLCGLTAEELEGNTIYKPVGCTKCSNTGFRGRRGVYELMMMNSEIRELTFNRAPVSKLRAASKAAGTRDLLGDGKRKILLGETTPAEIAKIAQVEGIVEGTDDEDDLAA